MDGIPFDILCEITYNLKDNEIVKLSQTNSYYRHNLIDNDNYWKRKFINDYGYNKIINEFRQKISNNGNITIKNKTKSSDINWKILYINYNCIYGINIQHDILKLINKKIIHMYNSNTLIPYTDTNNKFYYKNLNIPRLFNRFLDKEFKFSDLNITHFSERIPYPMECNYFSLINNYNEILDYSLTLGGLHFKRKTFGYKYVTYINDDKYIIDVDDNVWYYGYNSILPNSHYDDDQAQILPDPEYYVSLGIKAKSVHGSNFEGGSIICYIGLDDYVYYVSQSIMLYNPQLPFIKLFNEKVTSINVFDEGIILITFNNDIYVKGWEINDLFNFLEIYEPCEDFTLVPNIKAKSIYLCNEEYTDSKETLNMLAIIDIYDNLWVSTSTLEDTKLKQIPNIKANNIIIKNGHIICFGTYLQHIDEIKN